ncbi:hypothetical protein [Pseudofrankia sp. DC12]|uniref:hypothetical protein n=1 Tax=Pseudofrankia sp. DC12 TaxID=683315 RepID=UPI0006990F2E|nr:hypothetical protein [Pseudofrankia sp. DC12]
MNLAPLSEMLRAGARGLLTEAAAVDMLITHAHWLDRADFTDFVVTIQNVLDPTEQLAIVDWPAAISALDAGALPCSTGERHMLRLAASLADQATVRLGDAVTSLDDTNRQNLIQAINRTASDKW